jgi:hypothetical protein
VDWLGWHEGEEAALADIATIRLENDKEVLQALPMRTGSVVRATTWAFVHV